MKRYLILMIAVLSASAVLATPDLKIGLGVWIWQLEKCERGDVDKIVARAEAAHLKHVLIKVTQANRKKGTFGWARYNDKAKVIDLARKLRAKGIRVYAWGFHYPDKVMLTPQLNLIESVLAMGCFDGFIYNVEGAFANRHEGAENLLKPIWEFRNSKYPDKLLAYSTFCRVGRGQGGAMPLEAYSEYTDLAWPQVYWADFFPKEIGPQRVTKSVDEEMFKAWIVKEHQWRSEGKGYLCRPIIPTGHAYVKSSNTRRISAREVAQFLIEVKGYYGYNLYLWDKMGDEHWAMLKVGPQAFIAAHPEGVPTTTKVAAVVEKKPVQTEVQKTIADDVLAEPVPEPIITHAEAEQAQETHRLPWWRVLLWSGFSLWYLVCLVRSHSLIATRMQERSVRLSVAIRTIIVLIWAICVLFTDGYRAAGWLISKIIGPKTG